MSRVQKAGLIFSLIVAFATASPALAQTDRGKSRLNKLFSEVISAVSPSTVRIQCNDRDAALGTVVTADGYILTKGSELRGEISVIMTDGTAYQAEYVGYHKESDLALIKIDAEGLKPISFAEKDKAVVGNWVAIPGTGTDALAVGVVSAAARKLYFQEAIIENLNRGMLGIQMMLSEENTVVITTVMKDSAASRAGLKPKDVILTVGGKDVSSTQKLAEIMEQYRPGDTVNVKVQRGEEELMMKVKLDSRADNDRGAFQNTMGGQLSGRRTGFPQVIQHDTVISPVNCGGPLVDLDGTILGINIARAGRVETWALPVTVIKPILKDLRAGKYPAPNATMKKG